MNPEEEIAALEAIIDEIVATVDEMLQSGEELPENVANSVAEVVADATARIIELETQITTPPVPTPTPQPEPHGITPGQHPSSNVNGFSYNPDNEELLVQFHGPYPQAAGPVYKYQGVPGFVFDAIRRGLMVPKTSGQNQYHKWIRGIGPSHGASVNRLLVQGAFPYQRVA